MKAKTSLLCMIVLLLAATVLRVGAEEGTVEATSGWIAEGKLYQVKENQALFVGAFEGLMFVQTKQGKLDAAKMICPGLIEIDLDSGKQSGEGRCILTSREADRVYAKWGCAGELLQGCTGDFALLGGTGRFENISGSSKFEIRSDIAEFIAELPGDSLDVTAKGLAVWPALTYKIP